MAKKKTLPEGQNFTCPNPTCGKVFTNPLKTENLHPNGKEVYDACPYCLTEITLEDEPITVRKEESLETSKTEDVQIRNNPKEETRQQPSKVQGCTHHFGYLSNRSSKEKIPEECMVCENIVQCMLRNVTG